MLLMLMLMLMVMVMLLPPVRKTLYAWMRHGHVGLGMDLWPPIGPSKGAFALLP
jgi:hypothetical protein